MNAVPRQSGEKIDWVINYVEVNSRPASTSEFRRLRITNSELRIDPGGIVLTIGRTTDQGIELHCGSETYLGSIAQRGSEIVIRIHRTCDSDNIVIVAKRSLSEFELSFPFIENAQAGTRAASVHSSTIEPRSLF